MEVQRVSAEFRDVFSNGQIESKLWLCQELEYLVKSYGLPGMRIWVLGAWWGVLSFLLLSRRNDWIDCIRNFDLNPEACKMADVINENWVFNKWQSKAFCADANALDFSQNHPEYGQRPNMIINTSTEHFLDDRWFRNISDGTWVVLQNSDMEDVDHHTSMLTLSQLQNRFPLSRVLLAAEKEFAYPEKRFRRRMLIGIK